MKLKKGDFIELDYIARIENDKKIFDLTKKEDAEKYKIYDEKREYKPIIICIGHKEVIPGLDKSLINKEIGIYDVKINAEDAFGKKQANLIKLVPTSYFLKQKINPLPGFQVNMDGIIGMIKSVSGGRTIVDFNHPLAGKDVIYHIEIKRVIKDAKEKIDSFLRLIIKDYEIKIEKDKLIISSNLDKKLQDKLIKEIKNRVSEIKIVEFKKLTTPE